MHKNKKQYIHKQYDKKQYVQNKRTKYTKRNRSNQFNLYILYQTYISNPFSNANSKNQEWGITSDKLMGNNKSKKNIHPRA
jgi:hypothetical protein